MPVPWPGRHVRHEAIASARREKERSQAGAAHAGVVKRQIEQLAAQNHFAEAIAEQLAQGRHRRGEGT